MKKVILLSLMTLVCALVFTSCDKKKHAIDNLSDFVEKVEKNSPDYTKQDWEKVEKEYDELNAEIEKYENEYSSDEIKRIGKLKGKFLGIKTKDSIKGIINDVKNSADIVKGAIEGYTDEIISSKDSQEE